MGIGAGVHGLGKPRTDVTSRVARADCRALRQRRVVVVAKNAAGSTTAAAIGHLPPQPGLLNDVFGLRATAEHAIRDAEQPASYRDELRRRLLEVSRRGVARNHPAIQTQTACDVPTS